MIFRMAEQIVQDSLDSIGGISIRYARGESYVDVTAVIGQTRTEEAIDDNAIVKSSVRDFLIKKSVLVLDSVLIEPKVGDKITEGGNTYQVSGLGSDGPARDSGFSGYTWRIHTAEVAS